MELGELTPADGEAIQPSLTVDQKIAAVAGPVGGFEAAVGAVDGLNLSGGDIDSLQEAGGGGVLHQRSKEQYGNHHGLTVPFRVTPPAQSDASARRDDRTPSCRRASRAPPPDRQTSGRDRA